MPGRRHRSGAFPLTLAATERNLVYGDCERVNLPRTTR
jgi:hypothetical protein